MKNYFLEVLNDAVLNKWCVQPWCTTCGASDFRTAVAAISDIQSDLENVDLRQLISYRQWCNALRITAADRMFTINWGRILSLWLPYAREHIDFADHILYYLVNNVPCEGRIRDEWVAACVELAVLNEHVSLLESLVRILGENSGKYPELIPTALKQISCSTRLKNALIKAGLVPSEDEVRLEQKRKIAGRNLFGAIRRKDYKAIRALLARQADLTITDKDGRTPQEYAESLGYRDIVDILEVTRTYVSPVVGKGPTE
ncbi:MAG: hypothetical protein CV087_23680 [Candidatus Brocadia sp. WS118]|nr:MAG: hypothetical protein CV087_23680 [Candidatus Brocadia sp. WS118]